MQLTESLEELQSKYDTEREAYDRERRRLQEDADRRINFLTEEHTNLSGTIEVSVPLGFFLVERALEVVLCTKFSDGMSLTHTFIWCTSNINPLEQGLHERLELQDKELERMQGVIRRQRDALAESDRAMSSQVILRSGWKGNSYEDEDSENTPALV